MTSYLLIKARKRRLEKAYTQSESTGGSRIWHTVTNTHGWRSYRYSNTASGAKSAIVDCFALVFSRILVLPAGVTSDDKTDVTPAILSRDFVACACDKVADAAATVELHAATSSHRKHGFCTAFPVSRSSFTNTLAQFRNVMLIWFGLFTRQSRSVQLDSRSVCEFIAR